jgi:hypothetical protein
MDCEALAYAWNCSEMYCTKMTENLATGNFLKKMSV